MNRRLKNLVRMLAAACFGLSSWWCYNFVLFVLNEHFSQYATALLMVDILICLLMAVAALGTIFFLRWARHLLLIALVARALFDLRWVLLAGKLTIVHKLAVSNFAPGFAEWLFCLVAAIIFAVVRKQFAVGETSLLVSIIKKESDLL